MKEHNELEDLFRSSFDEFEATPPAAVKKAIDSAIDKKTGMWWLLLLLIVPVALLSVFVWNKNTIAETEFNHSSRNAISQNNGTANLHQNDVTSSEPFVSGNRQPEQLNARAPHSDPTNQSGIQSNKSIGTTNSFGQLNSKRKNTTTSLKKNRLTTQTKNKKKNTPTEKGTTTSTTPIPNNSSVETGKARLIAQLVPFTVWKDKALTVKTNQSLAQNAADSSKQEATTNSDNTNNNDSNTNDKKWLLSGSVGPGFGKQSVSTGDLNESNNLLAQLSIARSIGATNGAVQFATGWMKRKQDYTWTSYSDSIYSNGWDTIYIYGGPNNDSIIGTAVQPNYDTLQNSLTQQRNFSTRVFYLQAGWTQRIPISSKFGAEVAVNGAWNQLKFNNLDSISHFSVWNLGLGAGLYYDYKRFRFEAMANYRIEYWKPVSGLPFNGKPRTQFTPTIGIGYRF